MMEFISKRNRVFLKDNDVHKILPDEAAARDEEKFLLMLRKKGVSVPTVLRCTGRELTLEYLKGTNLVDLLCGCCETDWEQVAAGVIDWLANFYRAVNHEITGEIRGDVNCRNFIFLNSRIYGVDFEERCFGMREKDAGRLLAFARTYNAPRVNKDAFTKFLEYGFHKKLELDMKVVAAEFKKELREMEHRRGQ